MKKIFTLFAAMVAGVSMMAQSQYQKVTTTPVDWTGTYLIVCESQNVAFNGAADEENIDAKGTGAAIIQEISISDGEITGTPTLNAATFTISATDDTNWPWAIQSASGLYIGHKDSIVGDNGLSAETELKKKCKHTLAIDADGNFIATPRHIEGEAYNLQYNKKADQLRFRYFVPNDKQAIQIYKLVSDPTSAATLRTDMPAQKHYENGQLIITKNGQKFSILGVTL